MEWMADQEGWDEDTDKSNSSTEDESISSAGPMPLETAIRQNLRITHRALASTLGLSYNGIQVFMRRAQEMRENKSKANSKCKQGEDTASRRKKRKSRSPPLEALTDVTSPTEIRQ